MRTLLRIVVLALTLISINRLARAQDTLVRLNGSRMKGYGTQERKHGFDYYADSSRSQRKSISKADIYMVRFADGRAWPNTIGEFRQMRYYKRVIKHTGDTALALDRFPRREAPYDTLTLFDGSRIVAYGTKHKLKQFRFHDITDSSAHRLRERDVYHVRFATGQAWPPENGKSRTRRFAREAALQTNDWSGYVRKYAAQQSRILITAPGFHQAGQFPGVSVGLGFETFVDSAHRISFGAFSGKVWAGTPEGGKLVNGERRANIQMGYFTPVVRYHLGDMRDNFDPYAGLNIVLANHRRSDTWMDMTGQYSSRPVRSFMFSPQFELGVNINTPAAFTMQLAVAGGPQFAGGRAEGVFGTLALVRMGFRF